MSESLRRTSLNDTHVSLGARMVPFAGWDMPVQYGGILAEARAVRSGSGLFDVSHMGRLYVSGRQAAELMDWVLTAGASDLRQGRARYSMICNEEGGIIDDAVFYNLGSDRFLLVCNASNRGEVVTWMDRWMRDRFPDTAIDDRTESTAMIAFQGPASQHTVDGICPSLPSTMRNFSYIEGEVALRPAFIGRTGYTGEDGFELIVSAEDGPHIWETLMSEGAVACGLGARDVLRLEAGLALHGNDIDTTTTPLEARLDRFVRLDREFAGAEAIRRQKESGLSRLLVGLSIQSRSIPRKGYNIFSHGEHVGIVTSGTFSPTLDRSIAMGYVQTALASPGQMLQIDIRERLTEAKVVPLPFYSRKATG